MQSIKIYIILYKVSSKCLTIWKLRILEASSRNFVLYKNIEKRRKTLTNEGRPTKRRRVEAQFRSLTRQTRASRARVLLVRVFREQLVNDVSENIFVKGKGAFNDHRNPSFLGCEWLYRYLVLKYSKSIIIKISKLVNIVNKECSFIFYRGNDGKHKSRIVQVYLLYNCAKMS